MSVDSINEFGSEGIALDAPFVTGAPGIRKVIADNGDVYYEAISSEDLKLYFTTEEFAWGGCSVTILAGGVFSCKSINCTGKCTPRFSGSTIIACDCVD